MGLEQSRALCPKLEQSQSWSVEGRQVAGSGAAGGPRRVEQRQQQGVEATREAGNRGEGQVGGGN